jgi:hypothetical protein
MRQEPISYHRGWQDGFAGKPKSLPEFYLARQAYERGYGAGEEVVRMARLPPDYDNWKTRLPIEEPYCADPECTCTTARRDKWCVIHGLDPDEEMEKRRERQRDRDREP